MTELKPDAGENGLDPRPRSRRGAPVLLVVFALPVLIVLLLLGNWQVQRLHWKEGLLATISDRMSQEPMLLDQAIVQWQETGDVDYLPVRFAGTFMHEGEQHYLATYEGQSGWYLYTPLRLEDGGTIIVNRGFVPYDLKEAANRGWAPLDGTVSIIGLARNPLFDKPGWLLPENVPEDRIWYWKDFAAMTQAMAIQEAEIVPFFVDVATTEGEVAVGPIGGVTRVSLPNNHLQYAITWFGLAAALVVVIGFFLFRKGDQS
ncbi:MAG: SURF1 family protein [Pseudomonadota bacterium]